MKKYILIFSLFILQISFSQNEKAAILIEKGIQYLHSNDFEKAIHTFNDSQKLIDKSYSYQEQFLVYNNLGLIYYKISDFNKATKYFEQAYKLAKEANKPENEMTVLNNLAILFIKIKNYESAKKYLEQALLIANDQKDSNKYAIYATNLGFINYELKDYKKAKYYLTLVADVNKEIDNRVLISYKILFNRLLIHDGDVDKAIKNLNQILENGTVKNFNDELYNVYISLVYAFTTQKKYDDAIKYINLAFKLTDSAEKKKETFEQFSKIYFEKNEFEKAFQAKDSVIKYNEIIQKNINKESIENARLNFELLKSNYEIDNQKLTLKRDRNFYLIIFIIFIIACLLGIFLINKKHQNTKQKNILINQNLLIKEYEYNLLLESKEHLQNELSIFKKTDFEKDELTNSILKKHPNLTTPELRLITLIYLQTDTKEISQLLFITPETVRKRKERLKVKLGLEKNTDLFNYLHNNN